MQCYNPEVRTELEDINDLFYSCRVKVPVAILQYNCMFRKYSTPELNIELSYSKLLNELTSGISVIIADTEIDEIVRINWCK